MTDRDPPEHTVVTGAGGWLGSALLHRLLADERRGYLHLLAHSTEQAAAMTSTIGDRRGVQVVIGDISKADTAARLLYAVGAHRTGGFDVIHTAGVIHPRSVKLFYDVNTNGTRNLAQAALDAGARRFVHVSSNSPFGVNPQPSDTFRAIEPYNPYMGYGHSKMLAELAVDDATQRGLDTVIVRPPWFYGPFQPPRQTTFFRLVHAGRVPIVGDGLQRRSMVYIDNLVDGIVAAELTSAGRGKGYWIADARAYTVNEIVTTVGRALVDEGLSVRPPRTRLPALVGRIAELGDRVLQKLGVYQQQLHVLGEMDKTIACDIADSTAELGYQPRVELYEGMRASIRWCLERGVEL